FLDRETALSPGLISSFRVRFGDGLYLGSRAWSGRPCNSPLAAQERELEEEVTNRSVSLGLQPKHSWAPQRSGARSARRHECPFRRADRRSDWHIAVRVIAKRKHIMKPPLLLLRFAQGRYALILLAVVLLTIWGLAELHVRHRMLTEPFVRESHREDDLKRRLAASNRRLERRAATAKALI